MKQFMTHLGNFFFRHRNRLFPLLVLALFAVALPSSPSARDWLAIAIALCGLVFRGMVIGYAYIKRGGVNKKVYADTLVTEGLFAICRNPLYVGNMLIYIGVFLLHGSAIVAVAGILLFAFIYQCIIYAEEAFLHNKFGSAFERYCQKVNRWLPDLTHLHSATAGMQFNLGKAIKKDYSTIASTCGMLTIAVIYKHVAAGGNWQEPVSHLVMLLIVIGMAAGTIRFIKKRSAVKVSQ